MADPISGTAFALGGLADLAGFFGSENFLSRGRKRLRKMARFNPLDLFGPFGSIGINREGGTAIESPQLQAFRQAIGQGGLNFLGGGIFNDPNFQDAFQSNNIRGALDFSNALNSTGIDASAFDTSGTANSLLGLGFGALGSAGDVSGLINQNLDASRLLAEPFENQLVNRFNNQEFMRTGGATTGAFDRQSDLQDNLLRADAQRVLNAQQLGLQEQSFLGGLGTNLIGQGLNENASNFGRAFQSLGQFQTAGNQRLQNAFNLFGLGSNTLQSQFGLGLGAQDSLLNQNRFFLDAILGSANAESSRIGATSGFANAMAKLYGQSASNVGGFLGGIGKGLSSLFG